MRIIVIGGSGLIGSHLYRESLDRGHATIGTFRHHPLPGLERLDCARADDCNAILDRHEPDAVIHAAGWTWVDGCEDDPARAAEENCRQPVQLARLCRARGVRMAYISTSYIFDGSTGPYDEFDKPNPLNVYGRTKWEAEQSLLEESAGNILLPRVVCVYGVESRRKNFAYQVCDAMRSGRKLRTPGDQCGNPTWAGDIAGCLLGLIEGTERGVWHLGGPNPECNRTSWARHLVASFKRVGVKPAENFSIDEVSSRDLGQRALRPLLAGIVSKRLPQPSLPDNVSDSVYQHIAG